MLFQSLSNPVSVVGALLTLFMFDFDFFILSDEPKKIIFFGSDQSQAEKWSDTQAGMKNKWIIP